MPEEPEAKRARLASQNARRYSLPVRDLTLLFNGQALPDHATAQEKNITSGTCLNVPEALQFGEGGGEDEDDEEDNDEPALVAAQAALAKIDHDCEKLKAKLEAKSAECAELKHAMAMEAMVIDNGNVSDISPAQEAILQLFQKHIGLDDEG